MWYEPLATNIRNILAQGSASQRRNATVLNLQETLTRTLRLPGYPQDLWASDLHSWTWKTRVKYRIRRRAIT